MSCRVSRIQLFHDIKSAIISTAAGCKLPAVLRHPTILQLPAILQHAAILLQLPAILLQLPAVLQHAALRHLLLQPDVHHVSTRFSPIFP